jgi:cytochrome c oxidase subunit 4
MSTAHITPVRTYVTIWATLLVFTGLTVLAASVDLSNINPFLNTIIALAIAVTKASLVVFFFMGLRYNTPLTKVVAVAGLFWLLIMFGVTMSDYLTRSWVGVPGR